MNTKDSQVVEAAKSPFLIEFTMVICAGLRYMAYRDKKGHWRHAYNNSELSGPVQILC